VRKEGEMRYRKFVFGAAAGLILLAAASAAADEVADAQGFTWDIQKDGSIGDGSNDTFDGALHLNVNGVRFPGGKKRTGQDGRELVFGPVPIGDLRVTRKVRVPLTTACCRFLEIIENTGSKPASVQVTLVADLGSTAQNIIRPDYEDGRVPFVAVDQSGGSSKCVAFCMASDFSGRRVTATVSGDDVVLVYEAIMVNPGARVAFLHVCAQRHNAKEAAEFGKDIRWWPFLRGLDPGDRWLVRNVSPSDELFSFEGVDLFLGQNGDTVKLTTGETVTGRLQNENFALETEFGLRQGPASDILSMFRAGSRMRVVLDNGEVLTGRLRAGALALKLRTGMDLRVPMECVSKYGRAFSRPEDEEATADPEAFEKAVFTDPVFILRDGDRLIAQPTVKKVTVRTLYGNLSVGIAELKRIEFPGPERRQPLFFLKDGSVFSGLPEPAELPVLWNGGERIRLDSGRLATAFFAPAEDLLRVRGPKKEEEPEFPRRNGDLGLLNQDAFTGTLTGDDGKFAIETPFGRKVFEADEVMYLRPRFPGSDEFRVFLWDGSVFPGRPCRPTAGFRTTAGSVLSIPLGLLDFYWRPLALPPEAAAAHIEGLITGLGDADPQVRDTSQKELLEIGFGVRAALIRNWDHEDPETQNRVRGIYRRLPKVTDPGILEAKE
jgi:hypothetical protein